MNVETANIFFAMLGLAAAALAVGIVALLLISRARPDGTAALLIEDLRPLALWLAFAVAAVSAAGSLYYSESVGYEPCKYCWYQRMAMYPLALILGIAAFRRDHMVRRYAIPVAAAGLAVAVYHFQLERFPDQASGCSALVPCNTPYFEVFGFITLAFMALCGFAAIIALTAVATTVRSTHPDERPDAVPGAASSDQEQRR